MKSKEELKQEILDKLNLITPSTSEDEKKKLREETNDIISEYFEEEEELEFSMELTLEGVFYILFSLKLFNVVDISLWTVALPLVVLTIYELINRLGKHLNK